MQERTTGTGLGSHTPGPWRLSERQRHAVIADAPTGHDDELNVRAYGGHLVAESVTDRNLALIAAAPDLLVALQDLAEWLAYGLEKFENEEPTAADHARAEALAEQAAAAILKARGRA